MVVQPYLTFGGRCEEAIAFYRAAAGAVVEMMVKFEDAPDQSMVGADSADKIMHASLRFGGTTVYTSDGRCDGTCTFAGFSLSLTAATVDEADRLFANLADGGSVTMPMAKTFWAARFGMLTDRFGVSWLVQVET